jgi:membrane-bound metal-dependent hydrolase YbcI (DUF457 family)
MTVYEHAMLGWTLALATGAQRRHGWRIAGMAGIAAALPDIDGLSLLWGPVAFAEIHRVWGHNLLASIVLGITAGAGGYLVNLSARAQRAGAAVLARLASDVKISTAVRPFSGHDLAVWTALGVTAALSHLLADIVYTGNAELVPWPVRLLWPWSERGWELPIVPWGDLVTTGLLVGEMFVLYRWPGRAQLIACLTLLAIGGYVGLRWLLG